MITLGYILKEFLLDKGGRGTKITRWGTLFDCEPTVPESDGQRVGSSNISKAGVGFQGRVGSPEI